MKEEIEKMIYEMLKEKYNVDFDAGILNVYDEDWNLCCISVNEGR